MEGFYFYTANGNLSLIAIVLPDTTPHLAHTVEETPVLVLYCRRREILVSVGLGRTE